MKNKKTRINIQKVFLLSIFAVYSLQIAPFSFAQAEGEAPPGQASTSASAPQGEAQPQPQSEASPEQLQPETQPQAQELQAQEPQEQSNIIPVVKFKDADIKTVLAAISEKATKEGRKVNIVMSPKVEGLVTVNLEKVDWQTALEVVLKTYGYSSMRYKDVIIVAPFDEIKERETQERERQGVEPPQIKVFKLKYIDANDAKRAIDPVLSPTGRASVLELTGKAGWEFGQDVTKRLRAKEGRISRTKVLVVSDISSRLEEVEELLGEIDTMPKQVLIKARIMEVNKDLLRDIGLDWGSGSTGAEAAGNFTQFPLVRHKRSDIKSLGGHGLSTMMTPSIFSPETTGLTAANTGLKLVFKQLQGTEFEVILHALEEDVRVNTLSNPTILTLNNQEASILIGEKYPIIKTQVSEESSQIIGGSLERYEDIGIQLNVVPQICGENDEFINMIIHPAVTSYTQTAKVVDQAGTTLVAYPIIVSREAETQIVVADGETIVIGGLLKDKRADQDTGIPFLSKLPFIGKIFKTETKDTEKIDLLIFITAHIVKPGEMLPQEFYNVSPVEAKFQALNR